MVSVSLAMGGIALVFSADGARRSTRQRRPRTPQPQAFPDESNPIFFGRSQVFLLGPHPGLSFGAPTPKRQNAQKGHACIRYASVFLAMLARFGMSTPWQSGLTPRI